MMMKTNIANQAPNLPHSKVCTKCGMEKEISNFYISQRGGKGYRIEPSCKNCKTIYARMAINAKRNISYLADYLDTTIVCRHYIVTFYDNMFNPYVGIIYTNNNSFVKREMFNLQDYFIGEEQVFVEFEIGRLSEWEYEEMTKMKNKKGSQVPLLNLSSFFDTADVCNEIKFFMSDCRERWSPKVVKSVKKRLIKPTFDQNTITDAKD